MMVLAIITITIIIIMIMVIINEIKRCMWGDIRNKVQMKDRYMLFRMSVFSNCKRSNMIRLIMMTSSNGNIFRVTGPVPVNSPHKGQWRGALMFSLICAWLNRWVNNGEAGDLRRYCGHYDVVVMCNQFAWCNKNIAWREQAITRTNAYLLSIGPSGTNVNQNTTVFLGKCLKNIVCKMAAILSRTRCVKSLVRYIHLL